MGQSFAASESHQDAPPLATSVRWRIFAILLAYSFMSWFNRVSVSVAYNEQIRNEYPIDKETIGVVYSILFSAYALFMVPGGWFADRFGPWKALVVMGFGSALFQACMGLVGLGPLTAVGLVSAWMVVRALMGVFTAPIYPSTGRIVAHWFPLHQRAMGNGVIAGAAMVGVACVYLVFGGLVSSLGWQWAFVVAGTATALVALVWTLYGTNWPAQHGAVNNAELEWIHGQHHAPFVQEKKKPEAADVGWGVLLRNRSLILLTLSYGTVGYFEYLNYFWKQFYFIDTLHMSTSGSRIAAMILDMAFAAGMMLGGWISDRLVRSMGHRLGRIMVPVCGMSTGAVLYYIGSLLENPVAVVFWFSLGVFAVGLCEGPFWTMAIDIGGARGSTSAAICNTGGNVGGMIAPAITPWIARASNWHWAIAACSFICLAGVVLFWWIDPDERVTAA